MRTFYYQRNVLKTVKNDAHHHSMFRVSGHVLAELRHDILDSHVLLAADGKDSIISAQSEWSTQAYTYSAYGHEARMPSRQALQGFNGEVEDPLSSSYPLGQGYRTYTPTLMRFQSTDSLSPFGRGGLNCYAYCSGDPVNFTDPTGHMKNQFFHLSNGQTLKVGKNSAVPLSTRFRPSKLTRTTSHASALRPSTPRYSAPPEIHNPFTKLNEPDIFESIIAHLTYHDARNFAASSRTTNHFVKPIINQYLNRYFKSDDTMRDARAGLLTNVPVVFAQSLPGPRAEYLDDINRIQPLGGAENFLRLIRHNRNFERLERNARRMRQDNHDDLIIDDV